MEREKKEKKAKEGEREILQPSERKEDKIVKTREMG